MLLRVEKEAFIKGFINPLNMVIRHYNLGVTPIQVVFPKNNLFGDILIINYDDTNIVYVLTAQTQVAATEGVPLAINGGNYSNDLVQGELWIVAAAAGTDVRVDLDYKKKGIR